MKAIERKGNATLLAVTKKNNEKLWNKLTKDGEIWRNYEDTMANNIAEILAVKYRKKIIPLISDPPDTAGNYIPYFRIHSGYDYIALEAEVKKNKLYLLQQATFNWQGRSNPTEVFIARTFSLKSRNYKYKDGFIKGSGQIQDPQAAIRPNQESDDKVAWDTFTNKFDFFEEFGGNSYKVKQKKKGKKYTLTPPKKYNKKTADIITNFKPSVDKLRLDADAFGASQSFKIAKNRKALMRLARKNFNFLYDQKKGSLYYNENGSKKGFGDGGIIAILKGGPNLDSDNIIFI